jgi:hypothetical protein
MQQECGDFDMRDMTPVPKLKPTPQGKPQRAGRPTRTKFCLRIYGKLIHMGLPTDECGDEDRIDFFVSSEGFAVKIGPHGERAISKHRTGKTATLPKKIVEAIPNLKDGTVELVSEEVGNRTWFFPFEKF